MVVAGLVLGAVVVAGPGAPANAAVALAVTPSVNLVGGQIVDVTVTGLTPGASTTIWQCEPTFYVCADLAPGIPLRQVVADGTGTAVTQVTVRSSLHAFASSPTVTCDAQCTLAVGPIGLAGDHVHHPLDFDTAAPPVPFSITATPDVDLVDGQDVTVSATSGLFDPNEIVTVRQCFAPVASIELCSAPLGTPMTDAAGAVSATVVVHAVVDPGAGGVDPTGSAGPSTCAALGPEACTLRIESAADGGLGVFTSARAAITFGEPATTTTSAPTPTTVATAAAVTPAFTG